MVCSNISIKTYWKQPTYNIYANNKKQIDAEQLTANHVCSSYNMNVMKLSQASSCYQAAVRQIYRCFKCPSQFSP
jgi:hypothetical protein